MRVNFFDSNLSQTISEVGEDGKTKGQEITTNQGLSHCHILGEALIRLGTKDELIILVEQESLVFSFLEAFCFSANKMIDRCAVIKEILVQFVHFILRYFLLSIFPQDLDSAFFEDRF